MYLDLNNNQIVSIQSLKNLTILTVLRLSNNQIAEIDGIENLRKLILLDLRFNKIRLIKSNSISNNYTKFCFLLNNNLQLLSNFTFINNEAIELINIDNNLIKVVESMAFYFLSNMKFLSLNNNGQSKHNGQYKNKFQFS